jgi:hypothetical protein
MYRECLWLSSIIIFLLYYRLFSQDGLNGWTNSNNNALLTNTYPDCTIYHQPSTMPKFKILGPFLGGTNITKTVQVNRDTI